MSKHFFHERRAKVNDANIKMYNLTRCELFGFFNYISVGDRIGCPFNANHLV